MGKAKGKASPAGKGKGATLKACKKFWEAANQETIDMIVDKLASDPSKALATWRLLNSGMVENSAGEDGAASAVEAFPAKIKKVRGLPKPWVKKLLEELAGDSFSVPKVCKAGKDAAMELMTYGCGVSADWPLPEAMDKNLFKKYMVHRHVAMQSPLSKLGFNDDCSLDWEKAGCFSFAPPQEDGKITKVKHMLGAQAHLVSTPCNIMDDSKLLLCCAACCSNTCYCMADMVCSRFQKCAHHRDI